MKAVRVQYTVKPEYADTNLENIVRVMSALRESGSDGIRYQSFRTDEGNTFVHFGMYRDEASLDAMTSMPEFQAFQAALKASEPLSPPDAQWLDLVGSGHDIFA